MTKKIDWDVVFKQKLHEQMTSGQLAKHLNVCRSTVNAALERRNLVAKRPERAAADWHDVFKVQKLHQHHSVAELAVRFGVTQATLKRRLWQYVGSTLEKRWKKKPRNKRRVRPRS